MGTQTFAAGSGDDAGPLKVAVEMSFALLVAVLEQPTMAAFRIGQDLPTIIVGIPEEEAVGAVLQMRFGDFLRCHCSACASANGCKGRIIVIRRLGRGA